VGLAHPGQVTGTVLDANRRLLPNVTVIVSSSGDPANTYTQTTLSDGSYFFGSITPGTITVTVKDAGGKVIGTATGNLPYGGNVVIYVPALGPAPAARLDALLSRPGLVTGLDLPMTFFASHANGSATTLIGAN
jgi:hypothetical protein